MPSKTDHDSDAPERFTAKERDLIRREFMVRWGGYRPLSEGLLVYRWAGGPRKGTPKIGPTIQGMLDRGLVEIDDPEQGMPSARFTPAGFAALRAMARSAQMLSPKEYGHVLDQLEDLARPKRRRGRGPKAAEPAEPESPREPSGGQAGCEGAADGGEGGRRFGVSGSGRGAVCRGVRPANSPFGVRQRFLHFWAIGSPPHSLERLGQ